MHTKPLGVGGSWGWKSCLWGWANSSSTCRFIWAEKRGPSKFWGLRRLQLLWGGMGSPDVLWNSRATPQHWVSPAGAGSSQISHPNPLRGFRIPFLSPPSPNPLFLFSVARAGNETLWIFGINTSQADPATPFFTPKPEQVPPLWLSELSDE